jgi:membrane peptidoglycan carboxypeptidase
VTTLDAALQNSGQGAIWNSGLDPASPTALVMPSVDPRTGAVQTMITSRHYGLDAAAGQTTLPLFTTGYAGAGSTYKYFTALAALKLGVQPDFTLTTGSYSYAVRNCPTDTTPYTTHNAGTYNATLALRDALPESVNTYFVGMEDQLFSCDLSPIVNTALSLGMTGLNQPQSTGSSTSIAQATIDQHQTGFTLGFAPTAPLQLTSAYGTVANDGVFCPPTPVSAITGPTGTAMAFTRATCTRELSPQVARTMVNLLTADTASSEGTAASYFGSWYANGGSAVASKTGTDNDDPQGPDGGNGNSALWFVGVTPTLVSASALVNPTSPKATVTGLPSQVANNGGDVFGAYAATYWLDAYGPALQSEHWTWPDPSVIPGASAVPDPTGQSASAATSLLGASGFKISVASVKCASPEPAGTIGYYSPHLATPSSTVTVCLSSGVSPGASAKSNPSAG